MKQLVTLARERARRTVRYTEGLAFDAMLGVDTRGLITLGFRRLLRRLSIDASSYTFLDLGCGKGRTLLLAAEHGFGSAVGVDIAPELLSAAERNIARCRARRRSTRTRFALVTADAVTYDFPIDGPTLLCMYNPLGAQTMSTVARNLDRSLRERPRPFTVVYYIPRAAAELDRIPSLRRTYQDPRRAIYTSLDR